MRKFLPNAKLMYPFISRSGKQKVRFVNTAYQLFNICEMQSHVNYYRCQLQECRAKSGAPDLSIEHRASELGITRSRRSQKTIAVLEGVCVLPQVLVVEGCGVGTKPLLQAGEAFGAARSSGWVLRHAWKRTALVSTVKRYLQQTMKGPRGYTTRVGVSCGDSHADSQRL